MGQKASFHKKRRDSSEEWLLFQNFFFGCGDICCNHGSIKDVLMCLSGGDSVPGKVQNINVGKAAK